MKKLYLAGLALLATTAPAFAMPTASAAAIGVVKIVRRTKK